MGDALSDYLNHVFTGQYFKDKEEWLESDKNKRLAAIRDKKREVEVLKLEKEVYKREEELKRSRRGLKVSFNHETGDIFMLKEKYHYILACYQADRVFETEQPRHTE